MPEEAEAAGDHGERIRLRGPFFTLSTCLLLSSASAAPSEQKSLLERARALEKANRHEEAVVLAKRAAEEGMAEAWYWLGMNMVGDVIPFFQRAAEGGYEEAFPNLLDALLFRAGSKADTAKAKKFADLARRIGVGGVDKEALETVDRCFAAGSSEIPAPDRPGAAQARALRDADCGALRSESAAVQDWTSYRHCLLAQTDPDNNKLAEIYANGWGVQRNSRLALALVCHGGEVPAELMGMVETLYLQKDASKPTKDFFYCEHVTSGMNTSLCAAEVERANGRQRQAAMARLSAGWTAQQKKAFAVLEEAAEAFFEARASSEQDMSGTARGELATEEAARLRNELLASVESFEKGRLPIAGDLARSDSELNAVYGALMGRKHIQESGTVTAKGIRTVQRKWLRYRDAWAAFGVARYPQVDVSRWKNWVTRVRIDQLSQLAD